MQITFLPRHPRAALAIAAMAALGALVALLVVTTSSNSPPARFAPGTAQNRSCGAAVAPSGRSPWIERDGSRLTLDGHTWRFSGVNEYWLGLQNYRPDSSGPAYPTHQEIKQGIDAAAQLCARAIRSISLGVSVGSPNSLEPSLGQFNPRAFDSIDYAVAEARSHGIRLVVPLSDAYHYYTGGVHTFTNWLGFRDIPGAKASDNLVQASNESEFYRDPRVIGAFHQYIKKLLDHVNTYTGVRLGADPTIAVWELGNELHQPTGTWTQQTAEYVKTLAPHALVGTSGGLPGGSYRDAVAAAPAVDVFDSHYYPPNIALATSTAQGATEAGRAFIIGEYPIYFHALKDWYASIERNEQVSGDLAWSLLPTVGGRPEQHDDGYTFHVPPSGSNERAFVPLLAQHARATVTDT